MNVFVWDGTTVSLFVTGPNRYQVGWSDVSVFVAADYSFCTPDPGGHMFLLRVQGGTWCDLADIILNKIKGAARISMIYLLRGIFSTFLNYL